MIDDERDDILVEVATRYLPEDSSPEKEHYVFAYTVTIINQGEQGARLLNRHWIISDANGKVQEVQGDGVVGEQPYLQPGQQYSYSSGTFLATPVGSMQGSYGMLGDDGSSFRAPIPPFSLAVDGILH